MPQSMSLDDFISFLRYRPVYKNIPENFNNLLDIGCGQNPWFKNLKNKNNLNIYGIDRFDSINIKDKNINYIKLEIENKLPFNDNFFDFITMLAVLEHLDKDRDILNEIFRILKPNGHFILTVPTIYAKPILEFLAFKLNLINRDSIREHKRYYTKNNLRDLIKKTGFNVNKIFYFEFGFNLFVLAQKPF
ncbi:MAG: methyltransferase domain-containing protein [bacterium]|nr:methyltransferase domain-containing protein [bacterium]